MESEWRRAQLESHPLLGDLTKQYGADRVWSAVIETLHFPPQMVTGISEVAAVANILSASRDATAEKEN